MKRFHWVPAAALILSLCGAGAGAIQAPLDVVRGTTDKVVDRVKNERDALRADPGKMYALVSEVIFPHFDFNIMSQYVLGDKWKATDEANRAQFLEQFRRLLVRTYAAALLEYSDQTISYPPFDTQGTRPNTAVVRQDIAQPGSVALPVVYRLHNKAGDWKVFDVSVDGVSLVKTYKSSFNPIIKEGGIEKLIETLNTKNQEIAQP